MFLMNAFAFSYEYQDCYCVLKRHGTIAFSKNISLEENIKSHGKIFEKGTRKNYFVFSESFLILISSELFKFWLKIYECALTPL